ncbi:MAG: low molecular weight phosphatase family protein [Steroidobacteraceae bacterium]
MASIESARTSDLLTQARKLLRAGVWRIACRRAASGAHVATEQALHSSQMRRVLVVCHGNICRSPYAAQLLRKLLNSAVEVRSSGSHASVERNSPDTVRRIAKENGIDLSAHRSAVLSKAVVTWADLVVIMDRHNWQAVRAFGRHDGIVWLGTLDFGREIDDPDGKNEEETRDILARLHRCTELLAKRILCQIASTAT